MPCLSCPSHYSTVWAGAEDRSTVALNGDWAHDIWRVVNQSDPAKISKQTNFAHLPELCRQRALWLQWRFLLAGIDGQPLRGGLLLSWVLLLLRKLPNKQALALTMNPSLEFKEKVGVSEKDSCRIKIAVVGPISEKHWTLPKGQLLNHPDMTRFPGNERTSLACLVARSNVGTTPAREVENNLHNLLEHHSHFPMWLFSVRISQIK